MIASCDMWHGLRWFPYFEIVLTESRNIKTFLKKSYAVAWTVVEHLLKRCYMVLNMMLLVPMEFAYIIDITELCNKF